MYLHLLLKLERTIVDVGVLISGRGIFKSVQGTEGKGRERDLYPPTCRGLHRSRLDLLRLSHFPACNSY